MNTPNPLMPQGSLPQHLARGKSTVRIAVFSIIAVHAVFFTGLLWQGCNKDAKAPDPKLAAATNTANELPKLPDTAYYTNFNEVPATTTNPPATNFPTGTEIVQQTNKPVLPPNVTTPSTPPKTTEAKEYVIARGDTLGKIAKTHGVTLAELTKANPDAEPTKLKIGQKIQIPAVAAAAPAPGPGFVEPGAGESASIHTVKANETLTHIAKQHKTSVKALKAANDLKTDRLHVGQKLKLPPPQAPGSSTTSAKTASNAPSSSPISERVTPLSLGPTGTNR